MPTLGRPSTSTLAYLEGGQLLLIGDERPVGSGPSRPIIDPASGEQIAIVSDATGEQVNAAISAARLSFDTRVWRDLTPSQRQSSLLRLADLIEEHADILAELEVLNGGKRWGDARLGEVPAAAETFRYYAGWATKMPGETFDTSVPGQTFHGVVRYEPVGVVAQIVPWNGPLVMAAWKLAPALAAGCSVVLKPAELTPLSTLYLGRLILEAGIPNGVVNIVTGGGDVGQSLAQHELVDKVAFTGSTQVGKSLLGDARGNLKRLTLELGGKSPVLIFQDADLAAAIAGAAGAIFGNAGQVCVAGSRVYVQAPVFDEVLSALKDRAKSLQLGSGWNPETDMGPLISADHRDRVQRLVDKAREQGAEVVAGGSVVDGPGFFFEPTVIIGADRDNCVIREEVFGPVVTVTPFDDEEQAIALANDSSYGLAAGVWTRDFSRAHRLSDRLQAGIVWINSYGIPELAMPIGGFKQSGWGREHGLEGLKIYLEPKSIMARV